MEISQLLTQFKSTYFSVDCGMAYVMRLTDGKFAIIDFGYGEYDEPDSLIKLLRSQNEREGVPTVAAWFFTHPHNDHINGFIEISENYRESISVEAVYYNFPSEEWCRKTCKYDEFLEAIKAMGAEAITPKTGDILKFPGAVFEVLYTADDLHIETWNINETSLVMKMEMGKYSVLWLADIQAVGSEDMLKRYPAEKFKCDILQVGHHGYGGGSDELYRAADPEYLLWPIPEMRFHSVRNYDCNAFLKGSENVKQTFVSGIEETVIDMNKPIPEAYKYKKAKIKADFPKESIRELNWACYKGGNMGYSPLALSFTDCGCHLTTGELHSLLQIVQRGQIAMSDKYVFSLKAEQTVKCEAFGLIFDGIEPAIPDSYEVYPISDAKIDLYLEIDRCEGTAVITLNGKTDTVKLKTNEPCPLVLYLKGGELTINKAVFENK